MSSSTSNSDRDRPVRVILMVILFIAAMEGFTRTTLVRMSKDLRRFKEFDGAAERLVHRPGIRIALIGNSATDRGVEHEVIERRLETLGLNEVHVDRFVADSARAQDWYYIVKEYFVRAERRPDLFVFTFFGANLENNNNLEVGRLAQHFARIEDWPELTDDLPGLEDRAQFILSKGWATFAFSDRIKKRVLEAVCPGYRPFTKRMNDVAKIHLQKVEKLRPQSAQEPERRFAALRRLLAMLRREHLESCFVAFPSLRNTTGVSANGGGRQPYAIDLEARRLIAKAGFPLLDLRKVEGLTPDMYEDALHLLEPGRPIYSRRLADALAPLVVSDR